MKGLIKKIPVPITGLLLGLAASGNLVKSYGDIYRNIFGLIALLVLVLTVSKLILFKEGVKKALENPVVASVYPTLSMAIMILSTYLKPYAPSLAFYVWGFGVLMHLYLIISFSNKFLKEFNIMKVFPSWYIVYVGIVVGSVTCPAFGMQTIGQGLFWFGLISYLVLLPIVLKRVFVKKEIPKPASPTVVILCAPASLLLAGYMSAFSSKSMLMVGFLLAVSQLTYLYVLTQMPKLLKLEFFPSYSAFTFPMVITAISIKLTNGFLIAQGSSIGFLSSIVKVEELIALVLVLYVLVRYTADILSTPKEAKENTAVAK